MPVSQPAKETAEGAQAMIDDDFSNASPKPDVVLGQRQTQIPCGNDNKKDKRKATAKANAKYATGAKGHKEWAERVEGNAESRLALLVSSARAPEW